MNIPSTTKYVQDFWEKFSDLEGHALEYAKRHILIFVEAAYIANNEKINKK